MNDRLDIAVRAAGVQEIFDVRWQVLRPGRDRATAVFPGDDDQSTIHVGAFVGGRAVACASAMRVEWQGEPAWQLRGMGVEADLQRRGVGAAVLAEIERLATAGPVRLLWCNARQEACAFYVRHGWTIASERFDIPDVGPHFKMVKRV